MMNLEPHILASMIQDRDRELAALRMEIDRERQIAMRWEHEAKAYRKEVQALRMGRDDTAVIGTTI